MNAYLSINILVELICFIIACICLSGDKSTTWKSWIVYLLITCTTEITGKILRHAHDTHLNEFIYNIYILFEAGFTTALLSKILCPYTNAKPVIYGGLSLLILLYIIEIVQHGVYVFNNMTTTVMSVLFVLYGLYYYYLLLKDERYIKLKRHAPFWWVTGIVFFYFGSTVSNLIFSIIVVEDNSDTFRYNIYLSLNILLYSFLSYSFLCRYLQRTSSS
jgi:hypothetical protein